MRRCLVDLIVDEAIRSAAFHQCLKTPGQSASGQSFKNKIKRRSRFPPLAQQTEYALFNLAVVVEKSASLN
jgi:hypothetical protein